MKKIALAALIALASNGAMAKVDLDNSFLLSGGMTQKQVLETMGGKPTDSEFLGDLAEWHYCKRGWPNKDISYTTVFFYKGQVIGMKEYGVDEDVGGNCQTNIKGGSYQEPDVVKEYRIKYR
jgi:hypothetical protein